MKHFRTLGCLLIFAGLAPAAVPPSTGQGNDYQLSGGTAVIVTTRPASWGSQTGAQWIGPVADATKGHPAATDGNFVFTLNINVDDVSKANLTANILSDPDVDVALNGTFLRGGISGSSSPTALPITGLVKGANKLVFFLSDIGQGPVGLNVAFSGTLGASGPALSISPSTSATSPLAFSQSAGTSSSQTLTLTSSGDANLNITNIKLGGDLTGFALDLTSCLGANLSPGSSCKLLVTYSPGSSTVSSQPAITVTTNASPSTSTIYLAGNVLAPSSAKIGVNPSQVVFNDTVMGTNSAFVSVTITDTGTAPLTITSVTASDPNFFLDSSACKTLQPNGTCILKVQFRPTKAGAITANVSFGSNASNTAALTLSGRSLGPKTCNDKDNDGLCDFWETDGVHVTGGDGADAFIDLPAMGADPMYKDIFVHIDWMYDSLHNHKPNIEGMKLVQNAFRAAPVDNPNGKTGIHLHIDCGSDCLMDVFKGTNWGTLSKAFKLAEVTPLYGADFGGATLPPYDWSNFDTISKSFEGTGRKMIFHHAIFAHNLAANTTISGFSRNDPKSFASGASDLIVSVGGWRKPYDSMVNGGTLMHELGHNLGLAHGGQDQVNRKPNYLSVMNYNFQTAGLIESSVQGLLDYSRWDLPILNETDLNEVKGLNAFDKIPKYGTVWYCPKDVPGTAAPHSVLLANGWIDWNCDGVGSDGHKAHVEADLNGDIGANGKPNYYTDMTGYDDWSRITLKGGSIGGATSVAPTTTGNSPVGADLTAEEAELQIPLNQVRVTAPQIVNLAPGATTTTTIVINNGGVNPDTYTFTVPPVAGWISAANLPASVDVDSGASTFVSITLSAPASAKPGDSQQVSLTAKSKNSPSVGSAETLITVVAASDPVTFSSPTLDMGTKTVGTKSFPSPVTMTNTGTAAIAISGLTATGDFTQTNNCGSSLAAAASCVIQVTYAPTAAGPRTGAITITDSAPGAPHSIALKGRATPAPPVIGAAVHAASVTQGAFAPGTLITIYGTGMADKQEFISGIPLPTVLGGTTVSVNGITAPFTFASPDQINVQVPYELTPGTTGTIAVSASTGLSAYASFDVVAASPGIFIIPGTQHAAAQNADYSTNLAASPTAPGGTVIMYFTGQGVLDQTVATGAASPSSLARVAAPVSATVGGLPATVSFAGMTPGFAGLAQANIIIPATGADGKPLPAGDYPVVIKIGDASSNAATISVGK